LTLAAAAGVGKSLDPDRFGRPAVGAEPMNALLEYWARAAKGFREFVFDHVTQHPWVYGYSNYILMGLLVAGAVLIFILIRGIRLRNPPKPKLTGKPATPREAAKAAKQALKIGNFVRAGELFEEAGKFPKAIECYLKANAFSKAAMVHAKKLNDPEQGLALLEQHSLWEQAGDMLAATGRFGEAARRYQRAGKEQQAAESFEQAGELAPAADLYRKQKRFADAARCFSQNKDWVPAGEMFEVLYRHHRQMISDRSGPKEQAQLVDLAKKAAYHFKQGGQLAQAAELLLEAGMPKYAAELYVLTGDLGKAAELFLAAKEPRRAAELFDKSGQRKKAAEVMADLAKTEGRPEEAAKYLVMAEDYLAAADIYSGAEDYLKAAQLYLKGGDSRTASEMYVAAGRVDLAVGIFEQVGDMDSVIRLCEETGDPGALAAVYERCGRFYEAGVQFQERQMPDKALEMFAKVGPDHPSYSDAQYRLGALYLNRGDNAKALEALQATAQRTPLAPNTLEFYYLLALAYERTEQFQHAVTVFYNILAFDNYFKDAAARINMLLQKIQAKGQENAVTMAAGGSGASGRTLGQRYKILKELGRGGMGVVYLAEDTNLGRNVAFKVMSEDFQSNQAMIKSFINEYKNLAQLTHPYIVSLFDAGEEGGAYYIIMEFIEGQDLKKMLIGGKVLSVAMANLVFLQLAQALEAASKLNIIHRDIKPANIMWTPTSIIKVMDFGLAKMVDKMHQGRTVVAGSPYYMSPEQTLGRNVDHRADIYSMGVTMYELLAGTVPFKEGDIGYHHLHTPPVPPSRYNKKIPPALERIILKCMAKDVAQRYQTAREVINDLVAATQGGKG
jgi:eukaryotic-like serine/threonine-protein kinase